MSSVKNEMVSSNQNCKKAGGKTKRGKPVGRREVLEKYKAEGKVRESHESREEADDESQLPDDAPESHEESLEDAEGEVSESHESQEEADEESQLSDDDSKSWAVNECEAFYGIKDCDFCKWLASLK